jgi:hypothetical protein
MSSRQNGHAHKRGRRLIATTQSTSVKHLPSQLPTAYVPTPSPLAQARWNARVARCQCSQPPLSSRGRCEQFISNDASLTVGAVKGVI